MNPYISVVSYEKDERVRTYVRTSYPDALPIDVEVTVVQMVLLLDLISEALRREFEYKDFNYHMDDE
tara:strand:+ start:14824 stop:15024 length:201 start_codon:yes stop_codon:yes gene_type:complete